MIFGNVPPEAKSQYNLPDLQVFIPYTILLIKTAGKLVLNDAGAGDFGNQGETVFPGLDHTTSRTNLVVPSLQAAGMDTENIDTILITHAHPDHIGGLIDADDNLVFPNANYYVAEKEWDYWMSADPSAIEAEALRNHLEVLVKSARKAFNAIKDRVNLVVGEEEVAQGVCFESTFGHTPGHVMVSIATVDQKVYNISDVVVNPLFIEHPEWAPAIDMNSEMADGTRRRFFAKAATENALVFAHHLGPFPNIGRIVAKGNTWGWQPIEISD
jgi:glyoxylase-like metal-dependent hydrolase (beta-lactamase superfamily II)